MVSKNDPVAWNNIGNAGLKALIAGMSAQVWLCGHLFDASVL
jgi:hypothetical protein